MKTTILFLALAVAGCAQTAKVQVLQDSDATKLADSHRKMETAKKDYESKVAEIKKKYRLDFDPEFSEDFSAAVPHILNSINTCWGGTITSPVTALSTNAWIDEPKGTNRK